MRCCARRYRLVRQCVFRVCHFVSGLKAETFSRKGLLNHVLSCVEWLSMWKDILLTLTELG